MIWSVAYDTTRYGYAPIGESASCFGTAVGCPHDSLNVGTKTFLGAPYAGTDVDPAGAFVYSSWTGAYCDAGSGGTSSLRLDTGSYKPSARSGRSEPPVIRAIEQLTASARE